MKRSFHLALARPPRSFPLKTMPILRLPTVLFPDQKMALPLADSRSEALPSSSASYAAFGPGALVGVELSQLTAAPCQEQLLVGGSRVRLIRSRPSHDKTAIVGVLQRVVDVSMTPERAARLSDEAQWARQLASLAVEKQYLHMPQPAEMTTELMDASTLSLWLAARLPNADVKGAPTAGWFFPAALPSDLDDVFAPSDYAHFAAGTHGNAASANPDPGSILEDVQNARSVLNQDCVAAQKPDQWWACASAHKQYPYIKTPLYVMENMFDTCQVRPL